MDAPVTEGAEAVEEASLELGYGLGGAISQRHQRTSMLLCLPVVP